MTARNKIGAGIASNSVNVTPRFLVDIAVSNSNGTAFVNGGSTSGWLIDVDNATSSDVTGVRVRTTLPAQLTDIGWVCSTMGGAQCPAASGSGSVDGNVDLPAGSSASFLVSATVPRDPETPQTTTAPATLSGAIDDPQTANNSATDGPDTVGIFGSGFE